eukprot:CAMPEP_0118814622 /NCGR_PEP_ID=MMETSP1162-20130426/3674_1 /TAXON_ID=33656 /ORGANISM="Phaeocystis Sp, Strain CCMP2710" /LENGTH=115 /DNA_ID=CAMNT_0006744527 /DNA_START=176 /DNA_END=520 /DNA_ORIENTATION=+
MTDGEENCALRQDAERGVWRRGRDALAQAATSSGRVSRARLQYEQRILSSRSAPITGRKVLLIELCRFGSTAPATPPAPAAIAGGVIPGTLAGAAVPMKKAVAAAMAAAAAAAAA